jgi:hypothetical protein
MDIFAHTLWANVLARKANRLGTKSDKVKIPVGSAMFWGVFPDLFAFGIPIIISLPTIFNGIISGLGLYSFFPNQILSHELYNYSHSFVFFGIVFLGTWAYFRRPRFELLGWALHILIDIPSHVLSFFPTPLLFPLSSYHFPYGLSWADPRYMIVNYTLLAGALIYLYLTRVKKSNEKV